MIHFLSTSILNSPWRRALLGTLAVIGACLLMYRQVFFPWSALSGGDVIGVHAPFLVGLKRSILAGQPFPFWFKELCCGIPAIPDIGVCLLHPIYQLLRWIEVPSVVKLQLLFNLTLLFWGNIFWLRSQNIELKTSVFWSVCSIFFFPIQGLLSFGHLGIFSATVLLPWMLYCAQGLVGTKHETQWFSKLRCRWSIKLGLLFGISWITGHPQLSLISHELVLLYLLFNLNSWTQLKLILGLILASLLGLGLASPQLFPTAIHIFQSGRIATQTDGEFLNSGALGLSQVIRWFHPTIFGGEQSYWGQHTYWFGVLFASPFLLILFFKGISSCSTPMKWVLGIFFILALGGATPLYDLRQMLIPGAKLFRYSSRFIYCMSPFVILALCHGGSAFLKGQISNKLFGLGLAIALVSVIEYTCPTGLLQGFIPEHILNRREIHQHFPWTSVIIFIQLLACVFYCLFKPSFAKKSLFIMVFGLQFYLWGQQKFANTQLTDWPREMPFSSEGRVLTGVTLHPNLGLFEGFESLTGYVGMTPKAYRNFLDTQTPQDYHKHNRIQINQLPEVTLDYLNVNKIYRNGELLNRTRVSQYYVFANQMIPLPLRPESFYTEQILKGQQDISEAYRSRFGHPFVDRSDQQVADTNSIEILESSAELVRLKMQSSEDQILVGLDNTHPFWRARVDGENTPIFAWLGTFKSVLLPKGTHELEVYIDRHYFQVCLLLSLVLFLSSCTFLGLTARYDGTKL
jgi:hypothetical protein